ncbi:hypothetical protein AVEN_85621-1 [Araneus ventricosus]|uniref:Uncharacterized protein n=1 Tax=Araneus ventricosus TaxID=182803 RepID=A0A4Y2NLE3_ARAVE|nr:hypothetical protein AVEN_85621-1 [Araneus ventricosus]
MSVFFKVNCIKAILYFKLPGICVTLQFTLTTCQQICSNVVVRKQQNHEAKNQRQTTISIGCHDVIPADSKYLSPVARFWIKGTSFETKQEDLSNNLKERKDLDVRNEIKNTETGNSSV